MDIRYRLLDYMYTALYRQSVEGTPMASPMFYMYPEDKNTWAQELQYFYGPGLLVAPVTEENSTSVDVYLPRDVFYNFYTHERVRGQGADVPHTNQGWTDLPLYLKGGVIVPLRIKSAMTTTDLRKQDFEILVPLGENGTARGELYLDDGHSLEQPHTTLVEFTYEDGTLAATGRFDYDTEVKVSKVTVLGLDGEKKSKSVDVDQALSEAFSIKVC